MSGSDFIRWHCDKRSAKTVREGEPLKALNASVHPKRRSGSYEIETRSGLPAAPLGATFGDQSGQLDGGRGVFPQRSKELSADVFSAAVASLARFGTAHGKGHRSAPAEVGAEPPSHARREPDGSFNHEYVVPGVDSGRSGATF
jgi:hypothetical protein